MIIEKVEKNGLVGKLFSTKIGYHYRIYYNKTMVGSSYVYLLDKNLCRKRMMGDLESLDINNIKDKLS